MFKVSEKVFEEVMEMFFGMQEWWELSDSEKLFVVEEFLSWVEKMGGDL